MTLVLAWLFAGVIVVLGVFLALLGRERVVLRETERRSRLSAEHARLHLSVLARAGDEMSGALETYDDAMRRLVSVVVPTFADWFAIDLVDEAGNVHRVATSSVRSPGHASGPGIEPHPADELAHLHPEGDLLVRRVIESGRDVVLANRPQPDLPDAERSHAGALVGRDARSLAGPVAGVDSMVIVPVHVRGLALGALSFVTTPGRRGYRRSDLETAHGLADRVAVAVERVLLWRESRGAEEAAIARADQLRRLMQAALAVNAPLAEAEILRVVADHARQVLGARRASVCTLPNAERRDSDGLEFMAVVCSPEIDPNELGDLVGTVCELIARFNRPLRAGDLHRPATGIPVSGQATHELHVEGLPEGVELEPSEVPRGGEPWIAVPVPNPSTDMRRVIVVEGVSPSRLGTTKALTGGFGAPDESVLVLLAQIASVALVNADLYQEVRGSERRLRAVVESSPLAIAELSMNGEVCWCNRACEVMLDIPRRPVDERPVLTLPIHPDSEAVWAGLLNRSSRAFASVGADIQAVGPGSEVKDLSVSSAPLFDHGGQVTGIMVVAQDVTEHRRVLEQMHQNERLAAMARLAGGVAHDFNNLLTVVLGSADILSRRPDSDRQWLEELEAIQRAGKRAAALTAQLLAIGRRREAEPEAFDPDEALSSMRPMLERILGDEVDLEVSSQKNGSQIFIDPTDLERAVLNLAINARDAMSYGGRFELTTRVVDPDHRLGDALPSEPESLVAITATDTGDGMDQQTAEHCFEPFFSTKAPGKGTGLGLFAVHAIVTQAGGHVTVDSARGIGTAITLWFPVFEEHRTEMAGRDGFS